MSAVLSNKKTRARPRPISEGFGFRPDESRHHFVVTIPAGGRADVLLAEHLIYDETGERPDPSVGYGDRDAKLRARLPRLKWNAIADDARAHFNQRLKQQGLSAGRWKTGDNPVSRLLGKELTLLAWALEDADPALIPQATRNWLGLAPEERWWLYTMTCAATGHAVHHRNTGWRKAVRFALTENPVTDIQREPPPAFRLDPTPGPDATTPSKPATRTAARRQKKT